MDFDTCRQLLAIDNEDARELAMKTVRHHAQALLPVIGLFLARAVGAVDEEEEMEQPLTVPSLYHAFPDTDLDLTWVQDALQYVRVFRHLMGGELDGARSALGALDTFPRDYCPDDTYAWLTT